jgi:hypothetical protein
LLAQAKNRFKDASLKDQSDEGRFIAAYDAAHSAALAAMRWHGYRSSNRVVVFQALAHTLGWSASLWRVFDLAHKKRNLSLYEGFLEFSEADMAALVKATSRLLEDAEKLVREG